MQLGFATEFATGMQLVCNWYSTAMRLLWCTCQAGCASLNGRSVSETSWVSRGPSWPPPRMGQTCAPSRCFDNRKLRETLSRQDSTSLPSPLFPSLGLLLGLSRIGKARRHVFCSDLSDSVCNFHASIAAVRETYMLGQRWFQEPVGSQALARRLTSFLG